MTADLDLHWVAGVIDARGHIELNDRRGTPMPRIRVTTRHVPLLQRLADLTGVKVRSDDRGYQRRSCGVHCTEQHVHVVRQSASWTVDSTRATIVLYAVSPFMVARHTEAIATLRIGLDSYPPQRGDTTKQMAALGWPIPSMEKVEGVTINGGPAPKSHALFWVGESLRRGAT